MKNQFSKWIIIPLCSLLMVFGSLNAQNKMLENITLQHVTLVVSDFTESSEFYMDILGLKQIDAPWLPENQAFLQLGSNLELHMGEVPGVTIAPSTFNHFAMSVTDLDSFLEHLEKNDIWYGTLGGGEKHKVQQRPDGVRQTFFQDPDGYWLEVNDYKQK
ncbi:VOC family protein [Fulvivirga sedimenti]|uniref:VOC family protein n=1 Tax=Fulvivirga sedimenti TaxID=2879465 RepID=A0A9X1KX81_9BACT|nr:VOC family protein [Fulvivirga sedimenti]MCA6075590.1 VOC family protein [Fulvivirga sedimenti]MCA6076767.1 VOC family protein [Fulvivirga sedimenti]MCA6077895.1 VOC family protein [Fulvivirga sedimenti]